jgi:hypothetical protein
MKEKKEIEKMKRREKRPRGGQKEKKRKRKGKKQTCFHRLYPLLLPRCRDLLCLASFELPPPPKPTPSSNLPMLSPHQRRRSCPAVDAVAASPPLLAVAVITSCPATAKLFHSPARFQFPDQPRDAAIPAVHAPASCSLFHLDAAGVLLLTLAGSSQSRLSRLSLSFSVQQRKKEN